MDVAVTSFHRSAGLAEVMAEHLVHAHAPNEVNPHVADQWTCDGVGIHRQRGADRGGLLTPSVIEGSGEPTLQIEPAPGLLDRSNQMEPVAGFTHQRAEVVRRRREVDGDHQWTQFLDPRYRIDRRL